MKESLKLFLIIFFSAIIITGLVLYVFQIPNETPKKQETIKSKIVYARTVYFNVTKIDKTLDQTIIGKVNEVIRTGTQLQVHLNSGENIPIANFTHYVIPDKQLLDSNIEINKIKVKPICVIKSIELDNGTTTTHVGNTFFDELEADQSGIIGDSSTDIWYQPISQYNHSSYNWGIRDLSMPLTWLMDADCQTQYYYQVVTQ